MTEMPEMSENESLRGLFRSSTPVTIPEVPLEELLEAPAATTGDETQLAPLLADGPPEREHWRGYVLVNVNTNVEQVCDTIRERLGGHFRGMSLVTGIYDLIVRVEAEGRAEFKQTLILIRETPGVSQSVTLLDLNG